MEQLAKATSHHVQSVYSDLHPLAQRVSGINPRLAVARPAQTGRSCPSRQDQILKVVSGFQNGWNNWRKLPAIMCNPYTSKPSDLHPMAQRVSGINPRPAVTRPAQTGRSCPVRQDQASASPPPLAEAACKYGESRKGAATQGDEYAQRVDESENPPENWQKKI